jgi:hypothetical protein
MRIEQSNVALASTRHASVFDSSRSKVEAWVGDRPTGGAQPVRQSQAAVSSISAGIIGSSPSETTDPADPFISDPKLAILIQLIEHMTGHKIHLIRAGDVPTNSNAASTATGRQAAAPSAQPAPSASPTPPQTAGWGVDITTERVHQESETTDFGAAGRVVTADGRTITFDYALEMHRDLTQKTNVEIQAGDAIKKVDPIALNLSGGQVELSSDRTAFDIDSDGTAEQVAMPAAGTYFLALDRNGNGRIDNGSELFGPATGNGFTELQALDTDKNGWIDQGDAAYSSLKLWSAPDGGLTSLSASGVGALLVGQRASTMFDVRNAANETMGQVVASSVYLAEDGRPGALQQVDLTA